MRAGGGRAAPGGRRAREGDGAGADQPHRRTPRHRRRPPGTYRWSHTSQHSWEVQNSETSAYFQSTLSNMVIYLFKKISQLIGRGDKLSSRFYFFTSSRAPHYRRRPPGTLDLGIFGNINNYLV